MIKNFARNFSNKKPFVLSIVGTQYGDEGKGKLVDLETSTGKFDLVCRYNGGANAGHSVVADGKSYALHLLPSGVVGKNTMNILGNGVVVDLDALYSTERFPDSHKHKGLYIGEVCNIEEGGLMVRDRLKISSRAQLVLDIHKLYDKWSEQAKGGDAVGTTAKGIGPAYAFKAFRQGLRVADILDWEDFVEKYHKLNKFVTNTTGITHDTRKELELLKIYREQLVRDNVVIDTAYYVNNAIKSGKNVLCEGANGMMLDTDHGSYPFVTSSTTTVSGIFTGLGVPYSSLSKAIGVTKAYLTRVGNGPMPSEQDNDLGVHLQTKGREYGVTTGRKRRCGWLDLVQLQYSYMVSGISTVNLTKLDILDELDTIKVCTGYKLNGQLLRDCYPSTIKELSAVEPVYTELEGWKVDTSSMKKKEELPKQALQYIEFINKFTGVPVE